MKTSLIMTLACLSLLQTAEAENITNKIIGIGPKNSTINPYICIQNGNGVITYSLAPDETVDGNTYSENPYYVGASLRFGGCDPEKNAYLGYVGFSVNNQHNNNISTYSPPENVHIAYKNAAIDEHGTITGRIEFQPIQTNPHILMDAPHQNATWAFTGFNLSGLEFGKVIDPVTTPNLSEEDAHSPYSDLADTQSLLKAGMNTIRIPLSWSYLQLEGPGKGDINLEYYNAYIKPLLESLTSSQINSIVDLHSYMRYSTFGKEYSGCGANGKCPDGTLITDANAYIDVWTKLYTQIKSDPKINMNFIMFDLVNEPVDVPDDLVFTIQAKVIKQLREQGFKGYILVEGNAWSGLHSWSTTHWGKNQYTNASLFTRANFEKAGIHDLSKILINVHQYFDTDYSGTHEQCLTDLKTTGDNGFNLNAFTEYLRANKLNAIITEFGAGRDTASCSAALSQFMTYLQENKASDKGYGLVGWTIWSTGHGWGDYNLRVKPSSYQIQVISNYLQ